MLDTCAFQCVFVSRIKPNKENKPQRQTSWADRLPSNRANEHYLSKWQTIVFIFMFFIYINLTCDDMFLFLWYFSNTVCLVVKCHCFLFFFSIFSMTYNYHSTIRYWEQTNTFRLFKWADHKGVSPRGRLFGIRIWFTRWMVNKVGEVGWRWSSADSRIVKHKEMLVEDNNKSVIKNIYFGMQSILLFLWILMRVNRSNLRGGYNNWVHCVE